MLGKERIICCESPLAEPAPAVNVNNDRSRHRMLAALSPRKRCHIQRLSRHAEPEEIFDRTEALASADRETLVVNWPAKSCRGTVPPLHMAPVHHGTQFVVAAIVDYDPAISAEEVDPPEGGMRRFRPTPRSMRRHARLWSAREYRVAITGGQSVHRGTTRRGPIRIGAMSVKRTPAKDRPSRLLHVQKGRFWNVQNCP